MKRVTDTGCSFFVDIDESGDDGFEFAKPHEQKKSSQWLVISAIVRPIIDDAHNVDVLRRAKTRMRRSDSRPLSFRKLKHEHRVAYVQEIAVEAYLRTVTVLVDKCAIEEPEKFSQRNRLYFYASRYLLERVSWLCRDWQEITQDDRDHKGRSAFTVFSNRRNMKYEEFRDYLSTLKANGEDSIDWGVISPNCVHTMSVGDRCGLQIADAVASGTAKAVETCPAGVREGRYAKELSPLVYRKRVAWSYGLKFWPVSAKDRPEDVVEWKAIWGT